MPHEGRASRGRYPALLLAGIVFFCWHLAATPATAQDIQVTSADPPEMEQAQTIDVLIKGNGFDSSAAAKFFLSGTRKTGGVTVNSTTFIDSQTLRANVTAAADAVIASYDIEVQSTQGRRGKGIELFAVQQSSGPPQTRVRATFRNSAMNPTDRVLSDGKQPCGYHYVDKDDADCSADLAEKVGSYVSSGEDYFLRTVKGCCEEMNPVRWLVVDFSIPADSPTESPCPALDTRIRTYEGLSGTRNPDAVSPENPDPCVDFVEVRFFAQSALHPQAAFATVNVIIDGPDLRTVKEKGKIVDTGVMWNGKFQLKFVNPLTREVVGNTVVLTTMPGLDQVELWGDFNQSGNTTKLLGTYRMPMQLILEKVQ